MVKDLLIYRIEPIPTCALLPTNIHSFKTLRSVYIEMTNITDISLSNVFVSDGDSLELLSAMSILWMGIVNTVLMFAVLWTFLKLPGHDEGGLFPVYIQEHYSERTSQHLLDPYSFAHVSHGAIGFIVTFLTGKYWSNDVPVQQ